MIDNKTPSPETKISSANMLPEIELMTKIFADIEKETAQLAEELFDYLFDVDDMAVIGGDIPVPNGSKLAKYIKSLNLLFRFARRRKEASFKIINRRMVQDMDKKTYTFCMCIDGGISLDILCEVVNQENVARTPKTSPVKVTVTAFFSQEKDRLVGK